VGNRLYDGAYSFPAEWQISEVLLLIMSKTEVKNLRTLLSYALYALFARGLRRLARTSHVPPLALWLPPTPPTASSPPVYGSVVVPACVAACGLLW
jgi:hypothetical protein